MSNNKLSENQIADLAIISHKELSSRGIQGTPYFSPVATILSTTAATKRVLYTDGDVYFRDAGIDSGDSVIITSGAAAGLYTVDTVLSDIEFSVLEVIANSASSGTSAFYHPEASEEVGFVGVGALKSSLSVGTALKDLDYARPLTNDNAGAITVRQIVYLKTDGDVDLALASILDLNTHSLGIVVDASIASGATGQVAVKSGAIIDGYSGLIPGAVYVSRLSAGSFTQDVSTFVGGEHVFSVGRAIDSTRIIFEPDHLVRL